MPIEFRCTQCKKLLRTKDQSAGKQAKCPECGTLLTVPEAAAAAPPPPSAGGFSADDLGVGNPYSAPRSAPRSTGSGGPRTSVPQSTPLELGDVLSRTWSIYKDNLGICILAPVVVMAVITFAVMIGSVLVFVFLAMIADKHLGEVVVVLLGLACGCLSVYLGAGLQFLMLKVARGQEAAIGDLFKAGKWAVNIVLATLLFAIIFTLGNFVIIGGLIAILILWPFPFVIIDRDAGPVDGLKLAAEATKGNRLMVLLIGFVVSICAIPLIGCTLGLGAIFFAPYVSLLRPVVYLAMTGQPTAGPRNE